MENSNNLVCITDTLVKTRDVYEDVELQSTGNAILRILEGPIAEWEYLNRNSRKYSESLWDNVLNSPYVKEQLHYKTLYGEAGHPTDRFEVDFARVSHSILEMWKVPEKNQIFGKIAILDTPMGRIINTLYEAGGTIGYSSRAGGILHQRKDFIEVDEKTYNFITFDAVPYPSVIAARPGEITESTDTKIYLPEEVHTKLCTIINESSTSAKDALRELIYSIDGFDLTQEKAIFESSSIQKEEKVANEQSLKEATMSLLKESSSQIEDLRLKNQVLESNNTSLKTENQDLKSRLDDSVKEISNLTDEVKQKEREIQESAISDEHLNSKLKQKVEDLESLLEDKNLELEELQGIKEAFDVLKSENRGMKSSINSERSISEKFQNYSTKVEQDLKEAYDEVGVLVEESAKKDDEIKSLVESVELLKSELIEAKDDNKMLSDRLKKLREEVKGIKSKNSSLIKESKDDAVNTEIISELKLENTNLKKSLKEAQDNVSKIQKVSEEAMSNKSYAKDLVEVISGSYGIDPLKVLNRLPNNFQKSDVYDVCESFSNSKVSNIHYGNIYESNETFTCVNKNDTPIPRVEGIIGNFNRRGIGLM